MPVAARPLLAATVLFGVCGLGVTRLALPSALRAREALWVLPVGACSAALAMTVLGFLAVPFKLNVALVLVAGAALSAYAVRRHGLPRPSSELAWPAWIAVLLVAIALVPMFSLGFATVTGTGSDAHLAAGSAQFLQHSYPTSVNVNGPVDRMPLVWRSKFPIYYALGAIASLSGLQTYQALAATAALMLALAALGMYLLARDLLGTGPVVALSAMGIVGLDRMVLRTGLNPYFNQTWGYFTLPFALVLAWLAVRRLPGAGATRGERRRAAALLAVFLLTGAFAYPLALPIPLAALVVAWVVERRAAIRRGEPVLRPRDLYRGRRSLLYLVPLGLALAVPLAGVAEKAITAGKSLLPGRSLQSWGGDVPAFIPTYRFFALPGRDGVALVFAAIAILALVELRRQPRALALALGAIGVFGIAAGIYFSRRNYGWYFHFKVLAFVAPLILVVAAAGAGRLRALGAVGLAAMVAASYAGARQEIRATGFQLGQPTIDLTGFAAAVPRHASIRLDMWAPQQLWAAYFLAARRVCSQAPLRNSQYPSVQISRRADYVIVTRDLRKPFDAIGPPVRANLGYVMYRMDPRVPGIDSCSQRMFEPVTSLGTFR
ncbi:MAG TPA: hypothetical protein VIM22_00480 [Solirubrobacteraceae bacterium]